MNAPDVDRVIAAYDATVRANTTPSYDALRAVAEDTDGEVGLEVIETAEQLGYAPTDADVRMLLAAADAYGARLATELADRREEDPQDTSGPGSTFHSHRQGRSNPARPRAGWAEPRNGEYRSMLYEDHELAPATVLRGHVSQDTAFLVDDYPYSFELRCQIRYWLHTADKGSARGQVRLMSQTTNPKVSGTRWNKPKPSTYSPWAVMYEDSIGHVHWWPVSEWGPDPWGHLRFRLRTLFDQLNDEERNAYVRLLGRNVDQTDNWERAKRAFALIAKGATRDQLREEHHVYVDEGDHQIAVAAYAAGLTL
jgi:hypothetical protein